MAQLARLKKFNCFDKVKGGIQARTENKTKLCLEAWLHTVATCWQLTTQPVQITFLPEKKKKKINKPCVKRNQLVSAIFPALSGVRQWHQQNQLHCCSFLYHKACQSNGAGSFRRRLPPKCKTVSWLQTFLLEKNSESRYRAFKNLFVEEIKQWLIAKKVDRALGWNWKPT